MIKKKLENDILSDKQSNNVVIPEANIHHVENVESKLNVEEDNVESEKETTEKGKDQFTKEKERYRVQLEQKTHIKSKEMI